MRHYLSILKQEILQWKSIIVILLVTFFYIAIPIYALNYRYAFFMLTSKLGLTAKVVIIAEMFNALGTAFTKLDVALMVLTGMIIGINIVLFLKVAKQLKHLESSINLIVGGSGVIGLFSSGCASCGISFASVFGIGTAFGFLPFGNNLLYILAIGLSLYSIYYMVKQLDRSKFCIVRNK